MGVFSHSKLETYEKCPQKYKFRYIDGIPPTSRTIELHLGDSVHHALQHLYNSVLGGQTSTRKETLARYSERWDAGYGDDIRIVRSGTRVRDYMDSGRRMLESYYKRYNPFTQTTTLGVEKEFSFPLQGEHTIRGFIDRIGKAKNGWFEIHDYKTSRRLPSASQIAADSQLGLYEIGLRQQFPEAKRVSLVWHYLAFERELRSTRTIEQLETIKNKALSLIDRIERTRIFPTNVTRLCDWCEYKNICPAMTPRSSSSSMHVLGRIDNPSGGEIRGHRPRPIEQINEQPSSFKYVLDVFSRVIEWLTSPSAGRRRRR